MMGAVTRDCVTTVVRPPLQNACIDRNAAPLASYPNRVLRATVRLPRSAWPQVFIRVLTLYLKHSMGTRPARLAQFWFFPLGRQYAWLLRKPNLRPLFEVATSC